MTPKQSGQSSQSSQPALEFEFGHASQSQISPPDTGQRDTWVYTDVAEVKSEEGKDVFFFETNGKTKRWRVAGQLADKASKDLKLKKDRWKSADGLFL